MLQGTINFQQMLLAIDNLKVLATINGVCNPSNKKQQEKAEVQIYVHWAIEMFLMRSIDTWVSKHTCYFLHHVSPFMSFCTRYTITPTTYLSLLCSHYF